MKEMGVGGCQGDVVSSLKKRQEKNKKKKGESGMGKDEIE
jgi:hypothetical protein